jgi:hypothetical protein
MVTRWGGLALGSPNMSMLEIAEYDLNWGKVWDEFVMCARNGHFFFTRAYMEYHSDRFLDHSLVILNKGRVRALLPANRVEDTIYSHNGLSFGGLLVKDASGLELKHALDAVCRHFAAKGLRRLIYKAVPWIYHQQPAQEDLYFLYHMGATIVRRELSSAIALHRPYRYSKGKLSNLSRALKTDLEFCEESDPTEFMKLLEATLARRHNVKPTHNLGEISCLLGRFRTNMRVFGVRRRHELVAAALLFMTSHVAHTQYLASSESGREVGALDFLIDRLIDAELRNFTWLSFGISTEHAGKSLNEGLLHFKEAFGARGIIHETYELNMVGACA